MTSAERYVAPSSTAVFGVGAGTSRSTDGSAAVGSAGVKSVSSTDAAAAAPPPCAGFSAAYTRLASRLDGSTRRDTSMTSATIPATLLCPYAWSCLPAGVGHAGVHGDQR